MTFGYSITNPEPYYQAMATDPTQPPTQIYPGYPGGFYPGMAYPYGLYPGFYLGQRSLTAEDAERLAREKQEYMLRRSETSEVPEHKYINAEGRLAPPVAAAFRAAEAEARRNQEQANPLAQLKKKILASALIGSVVKTLLQ